MSEVNATKVLETIMRLVTKTPQEQEMELKHLKTGANDLEQDIAKKLILKVDEHHDTTNFIFMKKMNEDMYEEYIASMYYSCVDLLQEGKVE